MGRGSGGGNRSEEVIWWRPQEKRRMGWTSIQGSSLDYRLIPLAEDMDGKHLHHVCTENFTIAIKKLYLFFFSFWMQIAFLRAKLVRLSPKCYSFVADLHCWKDKSIPFLQKQVHQDLIAHSDMINCLVIGMISQSEISSKDNDHVIKWPERKQSGPVHSTLLWCRCFSACSVMMLFLCVFNAFQCISSPLFFFLGFCC